MNIPKYLFFIALISITSSSYANLVSPWDITTNKKSANLPSTYTCKSIPNVSSDLILRHGIYLKSDPHGSIRDPELVADAQNKTKDINQSVQLISNYANSYITSGDSSRAKCGATLLYQLAKDNALAGNVDGFQAHFTQAWILSATNLSWLKLRTDKDIPQEQRIVIENWIQRMTEQTIDFFNIWNIQNKSKIANMHYWSGLAIMSSGIVLNNNSYFNWGVKSFKDGIDQINNNGYLPNELKRGASARNYHIFSLEPLIMMAELGVSNNINLYNYKNNKINSLITTTINSVKDPTEIEKLTGFKQLPMAGYTGFIGWLEPYLIRFPNNNISEIVKKYPSKNLYFLGGNPPPVVNKRLTDQNP